MAMTICGKFLLPNGALCVSMFVNGKFICPVFTGFDAECVESALNNRDVLLYISYIMRTQFAGLMSGLAS